MKRRQVALIGLSIAALMAVIPPWRMVLPGEYGGASVSMGYDLIVTPPTPLAAVDLRLLIAQWMAVGAITAIAILFSKGKQES